LVSAFNGLTQGVYVSLRDRGFLVNVTYAINPTQMLQEIEVFNPQIILCPFLKSYLLKKSMKTIQLLFSTLHP